MIDACTRGLSDRREVAGACSRWLRVTRGGFIHHAPFFKTLNLPASIACLWTVPPHFPPEGLEEPDPGMSILPSSQDYGVKRIFRSSSASVTPVH